MPLDVDVESRTRPLELEDEDEIQEDQRNKRRRTDTERFPPGSIIRVSLKNFVTYSSAEFFPGPNMNLVIGPNGSGKSTIVCAICLGLGYSPNVLGRATAAGDFVQNGKDMAEIEIELAQENGKSIVVKRKIKRDKNLSTYYLNGKQDTHAKIQELMASFNIQIDNLCQFLPQDRVASFAQLSPTQLLHETQRAVGGDEMVAHWERLCSLRAEERKLQENVQNDVKSLTNLNQRQNAARGQVERLHKRNELVARIDTLKIRIPIAKYAAARQTHMEIRNKRNEAKQRAQELQDTHLPLKQQTDNYKHRKDFAKRDVERKKKAVDDRIKKIKSCENKTKEFDDVANNINGEIQRIRKAKQQKKLRLDALRKEIPKLENAVIQCQKKVDELSPTWKEDLEARSKDLKDERTELRRQSLQINDECRELKQQVEPLREREQARQEILTSMKSTFALRLEKLKKDDYQTWFVVDWLQKEGHKRFQKPVFLPPLLSLGVTDKSLAALAESCLRPNDLTVFTCSTREDYELFGDLVLDNKEKIFKRGLSVRVVENSGGKQYGQWTSPCSREKLKSLGFDFWLTDILTGPNEVINTLCHLNYIHALAISRRAFSPEQCREVERLRNESGKLVIEKYVAGNTRYDMRMSNYGNMNVSVNTSKVWSKISFLSDTVDMQRKSDLEKEVNNLTKEIDILIAKAQALSADDDAVRAKIEEFTKRIESNNAQIRAYSKVSSNLDTAIVHLETKKNQLETEQNLPDKSEELFAAVEEKRANIAKNREEEAAKLTEYVKEVIEMVNDLVIAKIKCIQAEADETKMMADTGAASKGYNDAMEEVGSLDDQVKIAKERAIELITAARKYIAESGKDEDEAIAFIQEANEHGTVEELEARLEEEENALRINQQQSSKGVLEQYEKRAAEIQEIEQRMAERQTEIERITGKITEYRQIWEPRLKSLITRVSVAFGEAFSSIGCSGEVLLSQSSDGTPTDDFEKWEIQIKVKFRETEDLQLLTSQRQSGGERSVSTIFYLMALQDLAKAPFRVVDEINQGMDPRNERLVHGRMVDAACRADTSQYFLITPKLLPGLKYHRNMKILTINNGKFVPQALEVGAYVQRALALQES